MTVEMDSKKSQVKLKIESDIVVLEKYISESNGGLTPQALMLNRLKLSLENVNKSASWIDDSGAVMIL